MSLSPDRPAIFTTLVASKAERYRACLMIDSLRAFGGPLKDAPVWVFEADRREAPCRSLEGKGVRLLPLDVPEPIRGYPFAAKVRAGALAEDLAATETRTLVWMNPECLIVQPPVEFGLDPSCDVAIRPVHIRNVGIAPVTPPDPFWVGIYRSVGVDDVAMTVESFVDVQRIRAYFNTHAFAINPSRRLLGDWQEHFEHLVADEAFQHIACGETRHRIFLHQALLSALLAARLGPERIRLLSPGYSYPYHLHDSVHADRKPAALNDLVCVACEDEALDPELIRAIEVREPLRSWLHERAGVRVREETEEDIPAIRRVHQAAFRGAAEADLVERLRERGNLGVSLVAECSGRVIGHIAFSPARIVPPEGEASAGTGLGPMGVLPDQQRRGVGAKLIAEGLRRCAEARIPWVVVLGHPAYYPRFGFEPAQTRGIRCVYDAPAEAFLVRELCPGGLARVSGTAHYAPEFDAL
jgi:putative acetyltransferase